jgi:hypothetical protein
VIQRIATPRRPAIGDTAQTRAAFVLEDGRPGLRPPHRCAAAADRVAGRGCMTARPSTRSARRCRSAAASTRAPAGERSGTGRSIPACTRTRQGVHATEAGRVLVDHADALLARLDLAEQEVAELAQDTWIQAHDGSAARLVDHILRTAGVTPQIVRAGRGDEPVDSQGLVRRIWASRSPTRWGCG